MTTTEYRRILLDGAAVEVVRDGDELIAADGRRVKTSDAHHLPPVVPSKVIAVHLNHRSRVEEFQTSLPPAPRRRPLAPLLTRRGMQAAPSRLTRRWPKRWLVGSIASAQGRRC